jgi:hypothetical protein
MSSSDEGEDGEGSEDDGGDSDYETAGEEEEEAEEEEEDEEEEEEEEEDEEEEEEDEDEEDEADAEACHSADSAGEVEEEEDDDDGLVALVNGGVRCLVCAPAVDRSGMGAGRVPAAEKAGIGVLSKSKAGVVELRLQSKEWADDGRTTHECVRCVEDGDVGCCRLLRELGALPSRPPTPSFVRGSRLAVCVGLIRPVECDLGGIELLHGAQLSGWAAVRKLVGKRDAKGLDDKNALRTWQRLVRRDPEGACILPG